MRRFIGGLICLIAFTALIPFCKASAMSGIDLFLAGHEELAAVTPHDPEPLPTIEELALDEDYEFDTWNENFDEDDLRYLSAIICSEANSMSFRAKVAVANVVLNRMNDTVGWAHVNTVYEVIYDRKWGVQFSPIVDGAMNRYLEVYDNLESYKDAKDSWKYRAMLQCIRAAKAAMAGYKSVPDDYLSFNAHLESSRNKCQNRDKDFCIMNGHIYY